jgi:hypothetical protein
VLIGESGMPGNHTFRLGGGQARLVKSEDGYCTLHSTEDCFVDLSHRLETDRYCFHLEIRHETSDRIGEVGLFFGATDRHTSSGSVYRLFRVSFNDRVDQNENIPPPVRRKPNFRPMKGNLFRGTLCCGATTADGRAVHAPAVGLFSPELNKPSVAPPKLGKWRTVEVEVSPPHVRIIWDRKTLVRQFDVAYLDSKVAESLKFLRKNYPKQPALQSLPARFDCRGAVGLYLFQGSASFRQARLEPLAARDGAK